MGNILISCDLNCCRLTEQMYNNLLVKLSAKFQNSHIHLYNFIPKKHTFIKQEFAEITHPYSGSHKRVAIDIEQALDTIKLALSHNYDMVYLLTGEYESDILYNKLTELNTACSKILVTASSINIECKFTPIKTKNLNKHPRKTIENLTVQNSITMSNCENLTVLKKDKLPNSLINKSKSNVDLSLLEKLSPDKLKILLKFILDKKTNTSVS